MAADISVIIPVYNRPAELEELLLSLTDQTDKNFDVIVVDDGSEIKADQAAVRFRETLDIHYHYKENSGPGLSRNYGCEKSSAGFFVFLDSDCIVPGQYIQTLRPWLGSIDAFGGPDAAHHSFTDVQKAISYSMTSMFTTGGIRGGRKSAERFHPRSFNMGFSREVFDKTGGFSGMRFGEDIDLSIRIFQHGFRARLIPECFVYHKRRTDFRKFYRQVFNSGIARINLYKRHPQSLKIVHFFPAVFVVYQVLSIPHAVYHSEYFVLWPTMLYLFLIFMDATLWSASIRIGILSVWSSVVQLFGYGLGFMKGFIKRIILRKPEFHDFEENFYK